MARRVAALSAVVLLGPLAGAAYVSAAEAPVVRVSPTGDVRTPRIGIDAAGTATVAWLRRTKAGDRVALRRLPAAGRAGPVLALSPASPLTDNLQLAVAPSGQAVVVWTEQGKSGPIALRARALTASGRPGAIVAVARAARGRLAWPRAVIDARGDAVLMWTQGVGTKADVRARRWPAGGKLGHVVDVSADAPSTGYNEPSVAIDAAGDALFAWEAKVARGIRIAIRPWPQTGAPGALAFVSKRGTYVQHPHVALNAGGAGVVIWGDGDNPRLVALQRSATGTLGPIRDIAIGDFHASLALGADGTAFVTASADIDPEGGVEAATVSPSGTVATTDFFATGYAAVQIASRPSGDALLVWSRGGTAGVIARALSPAAQLGPSVRVSPARRVTRQAAVAIGPAGRSQIVWAGGAGRKRAVETAAGP